MGDKENTIEYTPEELEEIERIINEVTSTDEPQIDEIPFEDKTEESPQDSQLDEITPVDDELGDIPDIDISEPDNLDLGSADLDALETDSTDSMLDDLTLESQDDIPQDISDAIDDIQHEEISEIDENEIEDISDFIQEVDDKDDTIEQIDSEDLTVTDDIEDLTDIDISDDIEDLTDVDISDDVEDLTDISFDDDIDSPDIDKTPVKEAPLADDGNALDQLNNLISDEPESIDIQDLAEDQFVGEDELDQLDDISGDLTDELPDDDFGEIDTSDIVDETEGPKEVSISDELDDDIPDLSDLSIEDTGDIPDALDDDIPDIDLGDLGTDSIDSAQDEDDFSSSIDDIDEFSEAAEDISVSELDEVNEFDDSTDIDNDFGDLSDLDTIDDDTVDISSDSTTEPADIDNIDIEPIDEESIDSFDGDDDLSDIAIADEVLDSSIQLSDKELNKLKKAIILFNPAVRKIVKDVVINERLPDDDINALVKMIISGKSESSVQKFLEKNLGQKIELEDESAGSGRRIIAARPEYTKEGRDRQKKLLKVTKIFGTAAIISFILTILGYNYVYKPIMAKRLIHKGRELILKSADYTESQKNINKAEKIFKDVDENYKENYIYGYNTYGRAYLRKKKYQSSIEKLNKSYSFDKTEVKTLNSLGYFYSKTTPSFYKRVKPQIKNWYFKDKKADFKDKTQLEIAIDFYKRSLLVDSKNIAAMLGIGNAYFNRGDYLKAKKYYEHIIAVDSDSIIGYSGLLNLYIERDSFARTATTHARIREKKMLHKIYSPLLAKLSNYYLSKRKSPSVNVRVDFGVQSPRIIDENDNTYPAVRSVLKALNKRDGNYPPLYLQYAKLHQANNSLLIMERYLNKALSSSKPKNYFDALHLLGEYNYNTKDPVKAYDYLKKAINSHSKQPDFTYEDFYKDTEDIGHTYSIMGNIFYYFFDKVNFRLGNLEDRLIEKEIEKMANFKIAKDKYLSAIQNGYSSPEVRYNLGRIHYLNGLYKDALNQWSHLYSDFVKNPELMFALGNAFYHLGNLESAKAEYLKIISVYQYEAEKISVVDKTKEKHIKIFNALSSACNNLAAIYQKQDKTKSHIYYWKAIDYSKRLGVENEFARVNMARSFKNRPSEPILDERVPFSIKHYRENMRK